MTNIATPCRSACHRVQRLQIKASSACALDAAHLHVCVTCSCGRIWVGSPAAFQHAPWPALGSSSRQTAFTAATPLDQTMFFTCIMLSRIDVSSCLLVLQRSWLVCPEGLLLASPCFGKGGVAGRSFSAHRDSVSPTMLLSTPCSTPSILSLNLTAADPHPPRKVQKLQQSHQSSRLAAL